MNTKSNKRAIGRRLLALAVVATAVLLALAGCSKKNKDNAIQGSASGSSASTSAPARVVQPWLTKGSGYNHATYRSNVHFMEQDEGQKALIGISSNDAGLLFDSSNATARQLKAGDVLVVKGLIARNVLGAQTTPDGVMVLTQQASFTDILQDGEIGLQAPVRFGVARASAPPEKGSAWSSALRSLWTGTTHAQSPTGIAASNAEAKGTVDAYGNILKGTLKSIVEGWDTTFTATPGDGRTDIDLTLKKDVGGFVALITGKGYLSNFDFDSTIAVNQSVMQKMQTGFKNLNGEMNFQWVISKGTPGVRAEESRIKLPGALSVPLSEFVGGLPLYLEVSAAILIHPAITGGSEYSKGAFRLSYDGYQSFTVKPGNIDSNGNVTGDIQLIEHQNISPTAPLGMVVAFSAPRIELSLGLIKIYNKSDIKKAADYVDKIADTVAKHLLNATQYNNYQNGPMGGFKLGQTFKNALSTDGAVYFQMIGTSATSYTGMSAITPCSRADLSMVGKVGATAEAWGQNIGNVSKDVFNKSITKVDPPGMKLCEDIGKS